MTSLPIMVYAVLDFEHEKKRGLQSVDSSPTRKYFLEHPKLYSIGLNNECISKTIFI